MEGNFVLQILEKGFKIKPKHRITIYGQMKEIILCTK